MVDQTDFDGKLILFVERWPISIENPVMFLKDAGVEVLVLESIPDAIRELQDSFPNATSPNGEVGRRFALLWCHSGNV